MIGQTISHYHFLAKLGAGGMGVVYKAEDTRLERIVALKFLSAIALGGEEKSRFLREAQAAAALNHPNIATIYAIEEVDGEMFIVMEYIEGKELRQIVGADGRPPLPMEQIIAYTTQIASGLQAAHAKGITHRDVKSSNIMVTESGQVKIMDFGLAKMGGEMHLTKSGMTLGTVAHMSPEQARGEPVDHRTDIWAFGVVLYEMLTGHLPFRGEYEQAVIYSILNEKPHLDDIQDAAMRAIVKKCLEKDKDSRHESIVDVLKDLQIDKQTSGETAQTAKNEIKQKDSRFHLPKIVLIVGSVVLLIAVYFAFFDSPQNVENLPPMKTSRLTSYAGEEYHPALSPDGKTIAFSWNGPAQDNFDIYVKLVDAGGNPVRLTTNALIDNRPEWSPDGRFIAFVREAGYLQSTAPKEIYIIPALGGREQRIAAYFPGLTEYPSISWSHDNKSIFFTKWSVKDTGFVIFKVSIETQEVEQVVPLPAGVWGDQSPRVSPDGKYVAFIRRKQPVEGDIWVKSLKDDGVKRITNLATWIDGFSWGNDSRSILFSCNIDGSSALWKTDFFGKKPEKVTSGININNPCLSATGNRLVYAETIENSNIWKIDLRNPEKETLLISSSTFDNMNPDISPDGKKITFSSNRTGTYNIWICENDGTNQTQLTFFDGQSSGGRGTWSPAGAEILINLKNDSYLLNASGGMPQKIVNMGFPIWSKDGTGFYSFKYPENKLYTCSKDGKTQKQITKGDGIMPYYMATISTI